MSGDRKRRPGGHVRRRGKFDDAGRCNWELKFDLKAGTASDERRSRYVTFRGTRREAEAKLRELLGDVDNNKYVDRSKITVAEYLGARLGVWKGAISARTYERYQELLERQITPHLGAHRLQELTRDDVERWYVTLREIGRKGGEKGVSARTVLHAHRVLCKGLAEAVDADMVRKNVAALAKNRPKAKKAGEYAILTPDQIGVVVTGMRKRANHTLFLTALFTGMRVGEIAALQWNAVDLDDQKVIEVRAAVERTKAHGSRMKEPKSDAGRRTITLPGIVVDALREHRRKARELHLKLGAGRLPDDALVFPATEDPHRPRSVHTLSRAWRRAARTFKIGGVSLHGLRHTHASQLISAGVDVVTISRRLGHSSPDVTLRVYAHWFQPRDNKTAAAIDEAVAKFLGSAR